MMCLGGKGNFIEPTLPTPSNMKDLSHLLKSGEGLDLTISIKSGLQIRVHRDVLAARTTYFANIITQASIDIQVNEEIMLIFIEAVYAGKWPRTKMKAMSLASLIQLNQALARFGNCNALLYTTLQPFLSKSIKEFNDLSCQEKVVFE